MKGGNKGFDRLSVFEPLARCSVRLKAIMQILFDGARSAKRGIHFQATGRASLQCIKVAEWQPMNTEPNDGAFRLYGLHVYNISHNISHSWLEIHYVALNEEGQLILPSGDNFDDWAFNDFECWAPAPRDPLKSGDSQ